MITITCERCHKRGEAEADAQKWRCPNCRRRVLHWRCRGCDSVIQLPPRGQDSCHLCGWHGFLRGFIRATAEDYERDGPPLPADDPEVCSLRGCVLVGGYGHQLERMTRCWVVFDVESVTVTPPDRQEIRLRFSELTGLEIGGSGRTQTGPQVMGGGFGVTGAAEGMALAAAINALSAKDKGPAETLLEITARDQGFVFVYTEATPQELRVALAGPLARVRDAGGSRDEPSASDELMRLHELHRTGVLTDDEYSAAKAKLIERL